jgi:membrane protease YdiL (CAAX protease family)
MSTLTINPNSAAPFTLRNYLAKHPFIAFFAITFAGTWLFFAPMVLGQDGLGLFSYSVPFGLYVLLFLTASFSGPTVAAIVVTYALEGKQGVWQFLRRYAQWRVGVQWYLLFLIGFPAIYLVAASIWMGGEPWQALLQQWQAIFTVYLPAVLIFPALINWGEEAGWRGFAQTRMQAHYGPLATSLLVGFLHGIWHLPIFLLVVGPPAAGPFELGEFLMNTAYIMTLTIVWTWLFNGSQQSILIASLTHAAFNATQALMGALLPNQPEQVGNSALLIFAAIAVLLIVLTKGQLGYTRVPKAQSPTRVQELPTEG